MLGKFYQCVVVLFRPGFSSQNDLLLTFSFSSLPNVFYYDHKTCLLLMSNILQNSNSLQAWFLNMLTFCYYSFLSLAMPHPSILVTKQIWHIYCLLWWPPNPFLTHLANFSEYSLFILHLVHSYGTVRVHELLSWLS